MGEKILMGIDPDHIPEGVIKAINQGTLVIFVGAGVSKLCGLPSWDEMANQLIDGCCFEKITLRQRDQYLKITDPREKITLAYAHYTMDNDEENFFAHINKMLTNESLDYNSRNEETKYKKNDPLQIENIDKIIDFIKLSCSPVITTNADDILDRNCFGNSEGMVVYNPDEFEKIFDRNAPHIIHIHGSVKEIKGVVFTINSYSMLYSETNFQNFIKKLFAERNILFIGYGLKEMELLIHIVAESRGSKHFVLNPYSSEREVLCEGYAELYEKLNIIQIPYSIGNNNYSRLNEIMGHWVGELNHTKAPQDIINNLNRISRTKPNPKDKDTLIYYKDGPYFSLFLKYLIDSEYGAAWFKKLSNEIFFDKKSLVRKIKELKSDERLYELTIFSIVFEKNDADDDLINVAVKIIEVVLSILKEEKNVELSNNLQMDCVHIISLIPGKLITKNITDYLKNIEITNSVTLHYFASEKCKLENWPESCSVTVFEKMMLHLENIDSYPSGIFIKNHLSTLTRSIAEKLFDYSIDKIANITKNNSFAYADVGSISVYPDDYGKSTDEIDFNKTLILIVRETIPHLPIGLKCDFVNRRYEDNELFKRIALLMVISTPELHTTLTTDHQKYIGPKCLISELYHQIAINSDVFDNEMVEFLVNIVLKTEFEEQSEDVKGYLLFHLIHRSGLAKEYCMESLEDIKKHIKNGDPYNVSKLFIRSVNCGNYFEEEKEIVSELSKKGTKELIECLLYNDNLLEHHDDNHIKNNVLSKHLSTLTLEEVFNDIQYYTLLNPVHKRLIFSKITNEGNKQSKLIVKDDVIDFLLSGIKVKDEEHTGYSALNAIDSLLIHFSGEQVEKVLNKLLSIFELMTPDNRNWSNNNVMGYYEKCLSTIICIAYRCFELKYIELPKKVQIIIENKLNNPMDWQLRIVIYYRFWYRIYDKIEYHHTKNFFLEGLISIDSSIKLPCVFELLNAGCTEPKIITWLFETDVVTSLLNDNDIETGIKRTMKYNLGEMIAYSIHCDDIFSPKYYATIMEKCLPLIDGYMLSGYFEQLNNYEPTKHSIEFTNSIMKQICDTGKITIASKSLNQRALCKYYLINEIDKNGWKIIIQSFNDRMCIIHEEVMKVLEKYSSNLDVNVLDVFIEITSSYFSLNQDELNKIMHLIERYENNIYDKEINEIKNNLARKGYLGN